MLKIGWIDFLNTLPFNFERAGIKPSFQYKLVKDVPSILNTKLRKGEIDLGIVSSAEYIENFKNYLIIPDFSISAINKVYSVAIFSNRELTKIEKIFLTKKSKSSRYLTKIIFEIFLKKKVLYLDLQDINRVKKDAILLIGDEAILSLNKFKYVYDLSEIWYKNEHLPFVFALWVVRKDSFLKKEKEIREFIDVLSISQREIFDNLDKYLENNKIEKQFLKFYLKNLDYSLNEKHINSLRTFSCYLHQLDIIKEEPEFDIITF